MIAQTRSELLKIRTTRTMLGLLVGLVVLTFAIALLHGLLSKPGGLDGKGDQRDLFGTGGFASIFALLAGVLVVTSEYRFGTIRPTFLVTPRRSRVVAAKIVSSALAGVVLGAVAEAVVLAISYAVLTGRDIPHALDGGDVALVVLRVLGDAALWGALGVGAAAVIRNQVATVIALLVWLFLVESLLIGFLPDAGRFLPGQASGAMTGASNDDLLSPAAGAAVFVGWVAALGAAGIALTAWRDVD